MPVDPELMGVFRKYFAKAKGSFVIRGDRPPLPPRPHQYFRCDPIFDKLVAWLRKHEVNGNKPLHTLRKEYGSFLTRRYGIHAASRALRHADLRTTSEHYSDSTARVTPGIDRLEWSAFQPNHNVIRIEPTRYFEPKTEHSIGDVQIDPELMSVFRGYAALSAVPISLSMMEIMELVAINTGISTGPRKSSSG